MIEDDIRVLLNKICSRTRRNYAASFRQFNIHVGQDHALSELWREEGVTQNQLRERMGCEAPTVTNMVKSLEQNGLIFRQRDGEDARVSKVYLTSEGKELQAPVNKIWETQQENLLEGILPEERLLLRRLMKQMVKNIS
ncbi:MarR family winged helix-turn-helix transcriptional regulator [Lentibacillus sp. Marseille-P4043]|uniref:MarR family winged helix-turn-helix transcriptional regulator n=1 Tax=Lentibacillus sp. Marseille-P4043 TaxID=2040293 RepID=UPI000D0BB1E6|nr:MarR family winged helix-turn-helix transcriptional regulator [Lentibacillus sp. Marseille-P4043]